MTGRDVLVVVFLSVVALASVPVAIAVDSVIPLFAAWIPQLGILVYLGRRDRSRRPQPSEPVGAESPAEAAGA